MTTGKSYQIKWYKLADGRGWIHDFAQDDPSNRQVTDLIQQRVVGSDGSETGHAQTQIEMSVSQQGLLAPGGGMLAGMCACNGTHHGLVQVSEIHFQQQQVATDLVCDLCQCCWLYILDAPPSTDWSELHSYACMS